MADNASRKSRQFHRLATLMRARFVASRPRCFRMPPFSMRFKYAISVSGDVRTTHVQRGHPLRRRQMLQTGETPQT